MEQTNQASIEPSAGKSSFGTEKMRWGKYMKPYWPFFGLGPRWMIVEVIGEVLMPKLLAYIIDYGVQGGAEVEGKIPAFVGLLYKWFGGESQSPIIVAIMVGMILTAILMMLGGVGGAYFATRASVNFAADLRSDLYRKVQAYSFSNIDKFNTGSLVTRLTNDVTQMQNFIMMLMRMALRAPGMLVGALIMAIILNPRLTLVLAVVLPLMSVCIGLFITKAFPRFRSMQTKIDDVNSTVQENITNVRVVKSFVREEYECQKFSVANANLKEMSRRAMLNMLLLSPVMTLFMNVATLAVLWFGGNMTLSGSMDIGDLMAFVTYITQILSSLMMVTFLFMQFSRAVASAGRIREVMEERVDISDEAATCSDCDVTRGEIEFRHVSFRYHKGSERRVLEDVNLHIPAGATVGIIGSTGSGKTTLVSMIPRLYDADEGEILVDGVNVKEYSLERLREGVGMVLQKNLLFSGTIGDNLRWGDPEATEEEVRLAASIAQADGFVSGFKNGYDSDLGQGGTNVSGGQKQRLCIARALLKKPKILILDDSTSAVDTATEAKIRAALRTQLPNSTKIIIAQRISSVRDADCILVLNEGRLTGMGTHDQLLENNVEYREIYDSQMEGAPSGEEVRS